jgi:hypothetical protein
MSTATEQRPSLPPDLQITSESPAVFAAAHSHEYHARQVAGALTIPNVLHVDDDLAESAAEMEAAIAIEYLHGMLPAAQLSRLGHGLSAVVLRDDRSRVFKVYRDSARYPEYEGEAGAQWAMHGLDLAARPHLFVDAGERFRADLMDPALRKSGFGDTRIVRQDGGRDLPVLVMDRLEYVPVSTAGFARMADEILRVAGVLMDHDIFVHDIDTVIDVHTGKLKIIDAGNVYRQQLEPTMASTEALSDHKLHMLLKFLQYVNVGWYEKNIARTYRRSGMAGVREGIVSGALERVPD